MAGAAAFKRIRRAREAQPSRACPHEIARIQKIPLNRIPNDLRLGQLLRRRGSGSACLRQIIPMRPRARLSTPRSSSRRNCLDNRSGENMLSTGSKSPCRIPAISTFGSCNACNNALSPASKKLIPLTVFSPTMRGLVTRSNARIPAEKSSSVERCAG